MLETDLPRSIKKILETKVLDSPSLECDYEELVLLLSDKKSYKIFDQVDLLLGDTLQCTNYEHWIHLFKCLLEFEATTTSCENDYLFEYINNCYSRIDRFIDSGELPKKTAPISIGLLAILVPITCCINTDYETLKRIDKDVCMARFIQSDVPSLTPLNWGIKERIIDGLLDMGTSNENLSKYDKTGDLSFLGTHDEIPVLLTQSDIAQIQMLEAGHNFQLFKQKNKPLKRWSNADLIKWKVFEDSGIDKGEIAKWFGKAKGIKPASAERKLNDLRKKSCSPIFSDGIKRGFNVKVKKKD